MYNDRIQQASIINNYNRKSNLDKPMESCSPDVVLVNENDD
jgi:hypothetical protein